MKIERVVTPMKNIFQHISYREDSICTPDGSETMLSLFKRSCQLYANNNYLGTIICDKLSWQTYQEVEKKVEVLSSFLNGLSSLKDNIGIFSVNRYEWLVIEYACYMSGCVNVPLYSTFGHEAISLVLRETEMKVCAVSSDKAKTLYDIVKDEGSPFLKHLILFDRDDTLEEQFRELGINVYSFDEIVKEGKINLRPTNLEANDIATLCYTSGTSGEPKGVILTHKNFICTISSFVIGSTSKEMIEISSKDVYLSYLPLAHVMERACIGILLYYGASVGFYRGNPKIIQKDYLIIQPTFVAAVPRVLNLFKEKIEEKLSQRGFFTRLLFHAALKYKIWRQGSGVFTNWLLDTIIFNKIKKEFGGRIKSILCGSASLNPKVCSFLQGVLCLQIFQGYGQTETTGATTLNPIDNYNFDNVGIPFPSNKIKLVPVAGYDKDCGEMYVKGCNVTQGYYKRPEQTKELFDDEGWAKTGDIARFKDGVFSIVGRRKEIFKTSFGEYIVPEKIETLFIGGLIQDMFISSGTYADKLTAVVVCADNSVTVQEMKKYVEHKGLELVEKKKISKYEIPCHIILLHNGFETFKDHDFLTPTAKKRRNNLERYFKDAIIKIQNEKIKMC